ncbi:TetR/AcrR family transcriptional regulator [Frankia nepalensis]|uniref:TetR/AcrR family transcriptional regulator n=1 Tax=Frankia nepalensis TaxID=1836974 RepID=A0A937ULI1_9ACTN|nr:TetR/AcrR family transcriptional regulator [Frankia nepalensis]MBL7502497.1 TetR/AcrR family transcriptional regulator [Frankia nepalensis]MBL7516440.1 TetR/AcrR family transcriptional regulator [Frankia nepalensis]MBL7625817.1 TetR/AcrR family transcriptional regulator [Frankia nepalensis]
MPEKSPDREAQRLETRQRVFDAAIVEFRRWGIDFADVDAIVDAANVARNNFALHFPTKEHILAELDRAEQDRMVEELTWFLSLPYHLSDLLAEVARLVVGVERRLGVVLFRDMLAFHFSPNRVRDTEWTTYPVVVLMIEALERAREQGEIHSGVDVRQGMLFFLLGLHALLMAVQDSAPDRETLLAALVTTTIRGFNPE